VKGHNFENALVTFLSEAKARLFGDRRGSEEDASSSENSIRHNHSTPFRLEEALVPVAVSVFDILRMKQVILSRGCMGKAARASAGFPVLFQPVAWHRRDYEGEEERDRSRAGENSTNSNAERKKWWRMWKDYSLFVDGGITDQWGLNGLAATASADGAQKRVVNMMVGDVNPSRSRVHAAKNINASHLVSIALLNTPVCGPHAMANGPRAVESTMRAMASLLDVPMERVPSREGAAKKSPSLTSNCDGGDDIDDGNLLHHYVLRVDASKWLD